VDNPSVISGSLMYLLESPRPEVIIYKYNVSTTSVIGSTNFIKLHAGNISSCQWNFPPTATKTPSPPKPNTAVMIDSIPNAVEQACGIFYILHGILYFLPLGEGRGDLWWWKGREKH